MNSALEVKNLRKVYEGGLEALKGIDLSIPEGSFYGLLGPNGAGKTTTIGIITGLVHLTSGTASVMGYDAIREYRKARRLIGLSPQELNFDVFFSIGELLTLQAGYYGLSHAKAKERTTLMLQQFGLTKKRKSRARELSGRKINKEGKTILLTTHYIEEAEQLCETVSIIDDGNIIVTDSPQKLIRDHGMSGLEITLSSNSDKLNMDSWNYKKIDGKIHVDTSQPEKDMADIISQISNQGCTIENVRIYSSSLEDVFMKLTGKSLQVASDSIETQENLLDV